VATGAHRILAADHEAAVDRRRDIVRVALQVGGPGEQLGGAQGKLVKVIGGGQAGDDRRGAGAQTAGQGDFAADAEAQPVGGMQDLERAHDEVVAPARDLQIPGVDGELPGLGDLDLHL